MIKQIRNSKVSKVICAYLALMIFIQVTQPTRIYALTSGPSQPEFNAFTPIGTSDMVNLSTGDFNYNIPIMDVGGYPLNLAYDGGVTMDQEASWVGLGWNLNVGQINRQVRGLPDDFKGDQVQYENQLRENITVGTNVNLSPALTGYDFSFNMGLGVQYNNYEGITFKPSFGFGYNMNSNTTVGFQVSSSTTGGAVVSPEIGISGKTKKYNSELKISAGLSSRQGLENISISACTTCGDMKDESGSTKVTGKSRSASGNFTFNTQSYTPTKRVAYKNSNKTFRAKFGLEIFSVETDVKTSGYGTYQDIAPGYKDRHIGAFGYENTQYKGDQEGVLDFNREKEQSVSENTTALPVTNYTYDMYNIQGQGVSGMFRPFRSQVSYVYNDNVIDQQGSSSFGIEVGATSLFHAGGDVQLAKTTSTTGPWNGSNNALPHFYNAQVSQSDLLYQPVSFRYMGEMSVDNEMESLYTNKLHENSAMNLKLDGSKLARRLNPEYRVKKNLSAGGVNYPEPSPIAGPIKRQDRLVTNQSIQKITANEADNKFIFKNKYAQPHHTAGIKIMQPNGSTYVFGETAYNTKKVEATFDVSGRSGDKHTGLIEYNLDSNGDVTGNGRDNSDEYLNRITTPGYAHTYLISSVLSTDYEDIDGNGPTDTDLGSYTKFNYEDNQNESMYNWRTPFAENTASYNPGLETSSYDQKGNYIYGEKELKYIQSIETKTHVALFELDSRKDAISVAGAMGGAGTGRTKNIKSIRLYSKPELEKQILANDPGLDQVDFSTLSLSDYDQTGVSPIKTAHFLYSYDLCKNIPSHQDYNVDLGIGPGKLTLTDVYFTYRDSKMGRYTPYKFDYGTENPSYQMQAFDIWGNYKKHVTDSNQPTNSEYPYTNQEDRTQVNTNATAWTLQKISLPSGGEINISLESDEYQYVQKRKAMQMFKVIGAGADPLPPVASNGGNQLFARAGRDQYKYIYVDLGVEGQGLTAVEFSNKYLSKIKEDPIYFKFHLNMNQHHQDYVEGYFEIDNDDNVAIDSNRGVVGIPLKLVKKEGGLDGQSLVNPISKAGWLFGRSNLNRAVYSISGDEKSTKFASIAKELASSLSTISELFTGPNGRLENKGCAQWFNPSKSWIRLENPDTGKLGGGSRVTKIELHDKWDVMTNSDNENEYYGQEYQYTIAEKTIDGEIIPEDERTSSGVATFEPNASKENPYVEPHYGKSGRYADKISAPRDRNYIEKPFGENYFPSPQVTYSRVTVSNIAREEGDLIVKRHATGKVVTDYYTTWDCPTKVDVTDIEIQADKIEPLSVFDYVSVALYHLTASQGFVIETNDMNAKIRNTKVYNEEGSLISGVDYEYNLKDDNSIDNEFITIDSKGKIKTDQIMGLDYDVINDFNQSKSVTTSGGMPINIATMIFGVVPVVIPMGIPSTSRSENQLRTASTTKVVYKRGILKKKTAYDLGSRVSTENIAWDAKTGEVLLTATVNEFNDQYYNFNFPAYWHYDQMGLASDNVGTVIDLAGSAPNYTLQSGVLGTVGSDISRYIKIGDELQVVGQDTKYWVDNVASSTFTLMDEDGVPVIDATGKRCKIVRSGNRNLQLASMASVTSMVNPIEGKQQLDNAMFSYLDGNSSLQKVINASAVEYGDNWLSQCENNLPNEEGRINGKGLIVNPYRYNIKGDWRPVRSYAYLTGRNNDQTTNRRVAGYFTQFKPFYVQDGAGKWSIDPEHTDNLIDDPTGANISQAEETGKWQYASEVTMYSPYGVELENKDALGRYSSAQYGYEYTLPTAVTSNSQYKEMGADNFEDYTNQTHSTNKKPHFGYQQALEDGVQINDQESHSGQKSIEVLAGKRASFKRRIDDCEYAEDETTTP